MTRWIRNWWLLCTWVLLVVLGCTAGPDEASATQKMYWADQQTNKIQRANLDGTNVEDLVTGLSGPVGIALDIDGGKVYWADLASNKIQRANLDGSNVEDLVIGLGGSVGIALDVDAGKMYWTEQVAQKRI